MIRKFTHYLLMSVMWAGVLSCQEEDVSSPPKPTFQVNKSSAEVGEEVTFTVNKVNADNISVIPYGLPSHDAGVLVNFAEGASQADVTFTYGRPGTFQAIVVANNHSGDGESVKNVQSDPITITIFSSKSAISAFSFKDVELKKDATIDEEAKTIKVTVPYGTDVTKLVTDFTASPFSTVSVNGTTQESGTTVNSFTSPVVYRVTANDGTASDYTVTVDVTPVETKNTIKSVSAVAVSKSADEKSLGVAVDNTNHTIVVYDTLGTAAAQFDSVRIGYELDGEYATLKYGAKPLEQDSLLNLTTTKDFVMYAQDSTTSGSTPYTVYAVDAPKLSLSFPMLIPDPAADVEPVDFNLAIDVLKGTDVTSIVTLASAETKAGVTVLGYEVDGDALNNGVTGVDYTKPVKFGVRVKDDNLGITYTAVYTVTVTVVPE